MKKMRLCGLCGSYTLSESHCERKTASAHPVRFDPNDRYGKYRRMMRCLRQS